MKKSHSRDKMKIDVCQVGFNLYEEHTTVTKIIKEHSPGLNLPLPYCIRDEF